MCSLLLEWATIFEYLPKKLQRKRLFAKAESDHWTDASFTFDSSDGASHGVFSFSVSN